MRAFAFTPDKFESVRAEQPDWYELPDGIHGLSGVDEQGQPFSYKLAVRKTPQAWFFLAYDMTPDDARRGAVQPRDLSASVIVFTLLSLLVDLGQVVEVWATLKVAEAVRGRVTGGADHQAVGVCRWK